MNSLSIGTAATGTPHEFPAYIDASARARHIYAIGQTGTGKSVYLENQMAQMAQGGEGFCFIDPHASTAESLITKIPEDRIDDLIYIDLADFSQPVGFNFTTGVPPKDRWLHAQNIVGGFKHVHIDSWGPRMEDTFLMGVRSLMDVDATLLSLPKLFNDKRYRAFVTERVQDSYVRDVFWAETFPEWNKKYGPDLTSPIINKLDIALATPQIRAIIAQRTNTIDLTEIMQQRKILIVSLNKGKVGEIASSLFGSLLVSAIAQTAMGRDFEGIVPFDLVCDEFQNYATAGFKLILSEARKYKLQLTLAHQGLSQLPDDVRSAIFDNCGTFVSFRIGVEDAPKMTKLFRFDSDDALLGLPNFQAWCRPLVDGSPGQPTRIHTSPPPQALHDQARAFRARSARQWGRGYDAIERNISAFLS